MKKKDTLIYPSSNAKKIDCVFDSFFNILINTSIISPYSLATCLWGILSNLPEQKFEKALLKLKSNKKYLKILHSPVWVVDDKLKNVNGYEHFIHLCLRMCFMSKLIYIQHGYDSQANLVVENFYKFINFLIDEVKIDISKKNYAQKSCIDLSLNLINTSEDSVYFDKNLQQLLYKVFSLSDPALFKTEANMMCYPGEFFTTPCSYDIFRLITDRHRTFWLDSSSANGSLLLDIVKKASDGYMINKISGIPELEKKFNHVLSISSPESIKKTHLYLQEIEIESNAQKISFFTTAVEKQLIMLSTPSIKRELVVAKKVIKI